VLAQLLKRLAGRRGSAERWDERWKHRAFHPEARLDEMAHHCLLAGYARVLKPGGVLLDAGCGDGEFRPHLHPDAFSRYIGIDFPNAIARAQKHADDRTTFVAADIRTYAPTERFDTIAFNESLFYIDNPVDELDRYTGFLRPGGVFLVSLHRKPKSDAVWDEIGRRFDMIDLVKFGNRSGIEWVAGCFRPTSRAGESRKA
jgi:SAM-dependent methyltransferase